MAFVCMPCILFFGGCSCNGDESGANGSIDTQYSVSFYTDSGDTFGYAVVMVDAGGLVTEPKRPVKLGYTFVCWCKDKELQEPWAFESDKVNGNIKLIAKWQKLDSDEGVVIPPDTDKVKVTYYIEPGNTQYYEIREINKGDKTSAPITPTKANYVFMYWCTDTLLTERFDFNTPITEDIKLYAKWKIEGCPEGNHSHTVGFYLNSSLAGAEKTIVVNHGDYIDRPEDVFNKYNDKEIEGWYTDEARTIRWSFKNNKVTKDLKLFAKFIEE